jgi:hypothetical protein
MVLRECLADAPRCARAKKKAGLSGPALRKAKEVSNFRLGFAETLNAVSFFPLAALFEKLDTLEAFQNVTLHDDTASSLEAFML